MHRTPRSRNARPGLRATRHAARWLVVAGLLLSILVGPAVAPAPDGPIAPAHERTFRWEAPVGTDGDLVARVTVLVAEPTTCVVTTMATGRTDPSAPVRLYGHNGVGAFFMSYMEVVSVGAPGTQDTRIDGDLWAASMAWEIPVASSLTFTAAAANLEWWRNTLTGDAAFVLDIDCRAPIEVLAFGGSREFLSMREHGMDGTSLTIHNALAVQMDTAVARSFTSDEVLTLIRLSHAHHETGRLTYHHPEGVDVHPLDGSSLLIHTTGGPGAYRVEVSRITAGLYAPVLAGVLVGVNEVDTLDALL